MANAFQLSILTRLRVLRAGEASSVTAPGSEGALEIRAGHTPLITALAPGQLTIRDGAGQEALYSVAGGFLEVSWSAVTILADAIERPDEIDLDRARASADRARRRLDGSVEGIDVARAEASLQRAMNRMRLATGRREYNPS